MLFYFLKILQVFYFQETSNERRSCLRHGAVQVNTLFWLVDTIFTDLWLVDRTVSDRGLWKKNQRNQDPRPQHFHKPQYLDSDTPRVTYSRLSLGEGYRWILSSDWLIECILISDWSIQTQQSPEYSWYQQGHWGCKQEVWSSLHIQPFKKLQELSNNTSSHHTNTNIDQVILSSDWLIQHYNYLWLVDRSRNTVYQDSDLDQCDYLSSSAVISRSTYSR